MTDCCAVVDLARSSYYHRGNQPDSAALRDAIADIARRHPTYGSRKIKKQLERAPYRMEVGRHLVRRLMREMNLLVNPKRRQVITTDSRHGLRRFPNLVRGVKASRPDQIWVADITYIRLRTDEIYLAILMDRSAGRNEFVLGSGISAHTLAVASLPGAGNPSLRPHNRQKPMSSNCRMLVRRSAWRPLASRARMAMPSG